VTPLVDVANFPSYPAAIIKVEEEYSAVIKVVPKDDVLWTHSIPSKEVASFPEAPTAIHIFARDEYVIAKIAPAPKDELLSVHARPSVEVASFPELPPAT
jgi:hypothetical protein